jgi:hypothetical protein
MAGRREVSQRYGDRNGRDGRANEVDALRPWYCARFLGASSDTARLFCLPTFSTESHDQNASTHEVIRGWHYWVAHGSISGLRTAPKAHSASTAIAGTNRTNRIVAPERLRPSPEQPLTPELARGCASTLAAGEANRPLPRSLEALQNGARCQAATHRDLSNFCRLMQTWRYHGRQVLVTSPSTVGNSGYLPCLISEANPRWTQGSKPENGESYQHTRQRPYRQHYGPSKTLDPFKQRQ